MLQTIIHDSGFQALLAQQQGMIFYKNHDHVYTAASDFTARLCGFASATQFHGHNDYELRCPATESAESFRAEDRQVFQSGNTLTSLQLNQYADGRTHIFMLKKSPVRDAAGNLVGLCGFGSEIINPETCHALFRLATQTARMQTHSLAIVDLYGQLSARESQVLFYFMRGFTNKETGLYMQLSPRTVETYIQRIKLKFKCATRSELHDTCLQNGLIYSIPQSIFGSSLNQSIAW